MSSSSSGQRQRSSKKKDAVRLPEHQRMQSGKGKDKDDVDQISSSLSKLSISESKNLSSSQRRMPRRRRHKKALTKKESSESTSEMPISSDSQQQGDLVSDSPQEEKWYAYCMCADFNHLPDKNHPSHKKDPQGNLIPKIPIKSPENPFGLLEVPPGITCEICDSSQHWRSVCHYMYEIPPDGRLCNTDAYQVICRCGNPDVNPPHQGCTKCVGLGFRVVHKPSPVDIEFTPSKDLLNFLSQPRHDINPSYVSQRDPATETYIPGQGLKIGDQYNFFS